MLDDELLECSELFFSAEEVEEWVARMRRFLALSEDAPLAFTGEDKIWRQIVTVFDAIAVHLQGASRAAA